MDETISIIIPVFNAELFLEETLDSALKQTYRYLEIICVDDCSTDKSAKIINEYVKRYPQFVRYEKTSENTHSPIEPRNIGLNIASGEYILFLDSDDIIHEKYCEKVIKIFNENPDMSVVYSKVKKFGLSDKLLRYTQYNKNSILFKNMVVVSAVFKKKDGIKYNGFNHNMKNGYEDWDFWLNFVGDNKKFFRINEVLFFYRIRTQSRNVFAKKNKCKLLKQLKNNHPELYSARRNVFNIYYYKDLLMRNTLFQLALVILIVWLIQYKYIIELIF